MKKTILKLKGVKKLTPNEQKAIAGGCWSPFDCCIRDDSPPEIPYGCEYYILC